MKRPVCSIVAALSMLAGGCSEGVSTSGDSADAGPDGASFDVPSPDVDAGTDPLVDAEVGLESDADAELDLGGDPTPDSDPVDPVTGVTIITVGGAGGGWHTSDRYELQLSVGPAVPVGTAFSTNYTIELGPLATQPLPGWN